MQLLEITTTPVQYEIQVEHARLERRQDHLPTAEVEHTPARVELHSQNVQLRLDSYEARRSLGIERVGDRIRARAQEGMRHVREKTREYVEMGQAMSRVEDGASIKQIIRQKLKSGAGEMYTAFLPSAGAEISWVPNRLETRVDPGQLHYDWNEMRHALNYVPGSVRLQILQYPSVDIRYTGTPLYFPPSSAPESA